jgi:hypothetical protein
MVGPVLDADGVAVTGGVVADFKISKNGGAPAALNGSATLTHRHTGHYSLALTASDLDTVGQAEVVIDDTVNACPIKVITVVEEAVYDILFVASATGAVPVASIANNAITAAAIATGAIDADALAADAITAAKVAADVTTEIQSGLATAAELAKVPKSDSNVTFNATAAAQFQQEATDALNAYDPPTAAELVSEINAVQADIAALNDPTVGDIADGVWDEVLSGATHNVASSAGRRLRSLQDSGAYIFGAVWLDTNSANTGSTFPEDGTFLNPTNTLARALTVAAAATQAIKRLYVMSGSSITLAGTYTGWHIEGDGFTLALGGQDVSGTIFQRFGACSGTATGTVPVFDTGLFTNVTLPPCVVIGVGLNGTLTVGSAGDFLLLNCHSQVAGAGTPTIDFGGAIGATTMSIRRWSGGLTLANVQAGDVVSIDAISGGTITVGGTGGTVHIRGMVNVTDSSAGAVTIVQTNVMDSRFDTVDAAVADLPTNAELATALGAADDAVLAQIALVKANTDKFANLPVLTAGGTGGQGYGAP